MSAASNTVTLAPSCAERRFGPRRRDDDGFLRPARPQRRSRTSCAAGGAARSRKPASVDLRRGTRPARRGRGGTCRQGRCRSLSTVRPARIDQRDEHARQRRPDGSTTVPVTGCGGGSGGQEGERKTAAQQTNGHRTGARGSFSACSRADVRGLSARGRKGRPGASILACGSRAASTPSRIRRATHASCDSGGRPEPAGE